MKSNNSFSQILHLGNSTFFLDVLGSEKDNGRYLRISERALQPDGRTENQRIMLNEDKIDAFAFAFKKMLKLMGKTNVLDVESYIEAERIKYAKAYTPWKPEEDALLEALLNHGKTMGELVARLNRRPGAIRGRIRKLRLEVKHSL